jgi:predicted DNA-binding transcriptional regulator
LERQPSYLDADSVLKGFIGYIRKYVLPAKNVEQVFEDLPKVIVEDDAPVA